MSNKNHQKCISRIKKRQVKIDSAHEKNIFDLLIKGHKAMSAYQIIDAYSKNYGQVLKPMQVYRVLKKLTERPSNIEMNRLSEPWSPYRGAGALMLWHIYAKVKSNGKPI